MPPDRRLLHALALAAKEYTLRTIKDLFVLAGAQPGWKRDIEIPDAGQRESAGWAAVVHTGGDQAQVDRRSSQLILSGIPTAWILAAGSRPASRRGAQAGAGV